MRYPRGSTIASLAVICLSALLTFAVGRTAQAATAWKAWNHFWNFNTFRLDNSLAGYMADYMQASGQDYNNSTDLTLTGSPGALDENLWRGNQGWTRTLAIADDGTVQWQSTPSWKGPVALGGLPGSGDMQAVTNYRLGNDLIQSAWRGNQGWIRYVPIVADAVQWPSAGAWSGPVSIGTMPGTGDMQAHGDYAVGNTLMQAIWRNNQGWSRSVPIINGIVQWGQAGSWSGPLGIGTLPGNGDMQAQDNFVIGSTYWQTIWRNNVQYTRSAPIINGSVQFGQATGWSNTTPQEALPGGGNVQAQGNYVIGWTGNNGILPHGVIRAETSELGPIWAYQGYTLPLNAAGQQCYYYPTPSPTGACDTMKATSARIFFNTTYVVLATRDWLSRHEMGHVYGLYHAPCQDPVSVMYDTSCANRPMTLQTDEINWINNNY